MLDEFCLGFSQSNPEGPGQDDVPRLLRTFADTLQRLPSEAVIKDLTFTSVPEADGNELTMTVYYVEAQRNEPS